MKIGENAIMFCPFCHEKIESFHRFCPACRKNFSDEWFYAGFFKRLAAAFIDWLVFSGVSMLFVGVIFHFSPVFETLDKNRGPLALEDLPALMRVAYLFMVFSFSMAIMGWLYYALMESSKKQATLGKIAVGIRVTDLQGNQISFGRATSRYFARILSSMFFGIGYLMAGFTEKKQALHDRVAQTLVVNK